MDARQEIKKETEDNYFYEVLKNLLPQIDVSKNLEKMKQVIILFAEAIGYYQDALEILNPPLPNQFKDKKENLENTLHDSKLPSKNEDITLQDENRIIEIILAMSNILDIGYKIYESNIEKTETILNEDDIVQLEDLTFEAGKKFGEASAILHQIITEEERKREWMRNPRL